MALSVIVTSYESPETLRLCLQSLSQQKEAAEIVVSDCSRENPSNFLQEQFPAVRFLHFTEPRAVPQLRWAALPLTTGEIVAATEARCIPNATWCQDLLEAHALAPESPAAGGTVTRRAGASRFEQALYFCEYGAYAPPVQQGRVTEISGANLSYKRAALDECADLISNGEWETLLHQRWVNAGRLLWQANAGVTFRNSMSVRQAFLQRWHYGRGYAGDRVKGRSLLLAFVSLGLPLLLFARMARASLRKGSILSFLPASGWILALATAWSWGETAGYVGGKPAAPRIF